MCYLGDGEVKAYEHNDEEEEDVEGHHHKQRLLQQQHHLKCVVQLHGEQSRSPQPDMYSL